MLVHIASTGQTLDVDVDGSTRDEVQKQLAYLTGIPPEEQLLVSAKSGYEARVWELGAYIDFADSEEGSVFLYREGQVADNEQLTVDVEPEALEVKVPPIPDEKHPLDRSSNPLLQVLPKYERQFKNDYSRAQLAFETTERQFQSCMKLLNEMTVQAEGLSLFHRNMKLNFRDLQTRYKNLMRVCNRIQQQYNEALLNLTADLAKLGACELLPELCTERRQQLIALVDMEGVETYKKEHLAAQDDFTSKVAALAYHYENLKADIDEADVPKAEVDVQQTKKEVGACDGIVNKARQALEKLSHDMASASFILTNFTSGTSPRTELLKAVETFDLQSCQHTEQHLPVIEQCGTLTRATLKALKAQKGITTTSVHKQSQKVMVLQKAIKEAEGKLAEFERGIKDTAKVFKEPSDARKVALAYVGCLREIVRRHEFQSAYMRQAEQLAGMREAEVERRLHFRKNQTLLPDDMLHSMGLDSLPSLLPLPERESQLLDINASQFEDLVTVDFDFDLEVEHTQLQPTVAQQVESHDKESKPEELPSPSMGEPKVKGKLKIEFSLQKVISSGGVKLEEPILPEPSPLREKQNPERKQKRRKSREASALGKGSLRLTRQTEYGKGKKRRRTPVHKESLQEESPKKRKMVKVPKDLKPLDDRDKRLASQPNKHVRLLQGVHDLKLSRQKYGHPDFDVAYDFFDPNGDLVARARSLKDLRFYFIKHGYHFFSKGFRFSDMSLKDQNELLTGKTSDDKEVWIRLLGKNGVRLKKLLKETGYTVPDLTYHFMLDEEEQAKHQHLFRGRLSKKQVIYQQGNSSVPKASGKSNQVGGVRKVYKTKSVLSEDSPPKGRRRKT